MNWTDYLSNYWWILVILLALIGWKFILRVFFGMVIVPEDKIGLVVKKFVLFGANKELPAGRIIATNGEAGMQAEPLAPGLYWGKWIWQYSINMESFTVVPDGRIATVMANDGAELPTGRILGRKIECDNFQNAAVFISNGGQKGKQTKILTPGKYRINTMLFDVTVVDPISIKESCLGIVTAMDGNPIPEGSIAGTAVENHNNFQDFDAFLSGGGCKGLQPQELYRQVLISLTLGQFKLNK